MATLYICVPMMSIQEVARELRYPRRRSGGCSGGGNSRDPRRRTVEFPIREPGGPPSVGMRAFLRPRRAGTGRLDPGAGRGRRYPLPDQRRHPPRGPAGNRERDLLRPGIRPSRAVQGGLERESLCSTGIGNGIAAPHPVVPMWAPRADIPSCIGLFFLERAVDFGYVDGRRFRSCSCFC